MNICHILQSYEVLWSISSDLCKDHCYASWECYIQPRDGKIFWWSGQLNGIIQTPKFCFLVQRSTWSYCPLIIYISHPVQDTGRAETRHWHDPSQQWSKTLARTEARCTTASIHDPYKDHIHKLSIYEVKYYDLDWKSNTKILMR